MKKEKTTNKTRLSTWLFNKPLIFTLMCLCLGALFGLGYALVQTFLGLGNTAPLYILFALAFILPAWLMFRKLPHEKMTRNDFIAIVNGSGMISIIASLIVIFIVAFHGYEFQRDIVALYFLHPTTFAILLSIVSFISLYLFGVALVSLYAKYKRAVALGISPWKVILSMPFSFLLMWTPGYLIKDKDTKSNLEIKCNWYNKMNKWVLANFSNTLFAFLLLMFLKGVMAGISTLILAALLLVVYTLWYVKHKEDFVKNINKGYAITAVCLNIFLIISVISQFI